MIIVKNYNKTLVVRPKSSQTLYLHSS